jgi:hypothetical protein
VLTQGQGKVAFFPDRISFFAADLLADRVQLPDGKLPGFKTIGTKYI